MIVYSFIMIFYLGVIKNRYLKKFSIFINNNLTKLVTKTKINS